VAFAETQLLGRQPGFSRCSHLKGINGDLIRRARRTAVVLHDLIWRLLVDLQQQLRVAAPFEQNGAKLWAPVISNCSCGPTIWCAAATPQFSRPNAFLPDVRVGAAGWPGGGNTVSCR
jgi:hypothetical protein